MASTISLGIGSLGIGLGTLGITVMLGVVGNRAALAQAAPTDTQPVPVAQTVAQYYDGPEIDFSEESPLPTIPRAFNQAYYSNRGNYFDNRQIWKSFSLIFGIPSYPEQAISRDGRAVHQLYRELMDQQIASDPVLRAPDLPSPYTGSILTTPLVITEDAVEPAPMFPPAIRHSYSEPAPAASQPDRSSTPSRTAAPVPALW